MLLLYMEYNCIAKEVQKNNIIFLKEVHKIYIIPYKEVQNIVYRI